MYSRQVADKLKNLETPFYLYDIELLHRTLDTVTSLAAGYNNFKLHYAIKANFDPRILQIIKEHGIGIDCASGNEARCAIEAGFDPKGIVYAGVGKKDSEIRYAISQGIFSINVESLQELEVIDRIAGEMGKVQDVALRINPDVDPKTHHCINTGQADAKFGISYEEVMANAALIQSYKNVCVKGMHLHIGSQILQLDVFESLCEKVNAIADKLISLGFSFDFLDLGGGLGINYMDPEGDPIPHFGELFSIIDKHLKAEGREVHFEFGRALVAQCGELIAHALFRKDTATGKKLVIIDASMTELIRPMLYGAHHEIENLTSTSEQTETYAVVGTACESTDVFNDSITLPVTKRGDLFTIKSAGAYGMSMASRYNQHNLPGAVYSDEL